MKAHLLIAFGLLIGAIFVARGLEALNEPGFGLRELYVIGGFVIASLVVRLGLKARKDDLDS